MEPVVRLTPAAATRFRALTAGETAPSIGLRVYTTSGGCSGFRYGMMIEDTAQESDTTFESDGIRIYLDAASVPLLAGASIDYVDSLMGAGFTVDNPNAVAACGCGSSVRTADASGNPGACGVR